MKYLENLHGHIVSLKIEGKGVVNANSEEVLMIVHILSKVE